MRYSNINIRLKGAPELDVEELEKVLAEFFKEQYNVPVECKFSLFTCYQCDNHQTCAGSSVICKLNSLENGFIQPIQEAQECKNVSLVSSLK